MDTQWTVSSIRRMNLVFSCCAGMFCIFIFWTYHGHSGIAVAAIIP